MTATTIQPLSPAERQQREADNNAANQARAKIRRLFAPEIAAALCDRIDDGVRLPGFVDRRRWRSLVDQVLALPEPATVPKPGGFP